MLKKAFILKRVAIMALTTSFLASCTSILKPPSASVDNARLVDVTTEAINVSVLLTLSNPNSLEITLSNIKAKFFLSDVEAGTISSVQKEHTLPANGKVSIPLRVQIPIKSLPEALKRSAIGLIRLNLPYQITGSVDVANGIITVPFERKGSLSR